MQKVIITDQKVEYIKITPEEKAQRLAEAEQWKVEQARQKKRATKSQLVKYLLELREMKQNRNVFTQEDIDGKQEEIDRLKGEL